MDDATRKAVEAVYGETLSDENAAAEFVRQRNMSRWAKQRKCSGLFDDRVGVAE